MEVASWRAEPLIECEGIVVARGKGGRDGRGGREERRSWDVECNDDGRRGEAEPEVCI